MAKKYFGALLGLILFAGFMIRIAGVADPNNGFYVDEASLAFNARSIWETGTDEYGQKMPLALRSFGDFKTPLFAYLSAPLVVFLGEVVGIRLSSVIFGVMTIWLVAKISKKIAGEKAGLLSGIILAIMPWHVNLSRHGIEAVLAAMMLAAAMLFYVNKKYLVSLSILALSSLAYHSTKYLSPIFALAIFVDAWQKKKINGKNKVGWLVVAILWLGILMIDLQPFANSRAAGVKQALSVRNVLAAYLSYFSPRGLVNGDWQLRNNVYGINNVGLWTVGLFYVGAWRATKEIAQGKQDNLYLMLLFVLALAPLPAAATIDPFHSIRSLILVVPMAILAGIGGSWWFEKLAINYRRIFIFLLVLMVGWHTLLLSERILVQNKLAAYEAWGGGYQELIDGVLGLNLDNYLKVVVDTTDASAIYTLWQVFGKVDTKQKIPLPRQTGYYEPVKWVGPESLVLGNGQKIFFKPVYWPKDQRLANTLYVGSKWRFDPDAVKRAGAEVLVEVRDLTGELVWMAVATRN